ncbi:MAG TPA: hypothetical protein VF062_09870, partial [Candidatus Limnocylindrales bacterium]
VSLDRAAQVHVSTMWGQVNVDRIGGGGHITGTGEVRIQEIAGNATVKNLNGDSWIGEVTGDISLNAANGNIIVERPGGDVIARTAHGSIQVGRLIRGKAELKTAFGQLDIGIAKGVAAWLDVKSSGGIVHNSMTPGDAPQAGDGGTVEVRGRTAAGNIHIHHATV